ncbi:cytochrome P450 1A4-like [Pitangus sulphuratus]|nr:cytochrome P450 1A4-like [Pitangus sulphuratus]
MSCEMKLESFCLRKVRPRLFNLPKTIRGIFYPVLRAKIGTTKATVLNGYYIPKNTCVFINQWQVNHDENLWKEPSAFNPERFLNPEGTEINRTESEKVLSFGLGKRRCIGETIGRWEIFLFLTTLLQQLEFSLHPGEEVDITPQYGLTMKYKKCECFQIKQRFPGKSSP